jgi:hypothetical protein
MFCAVCAALSKATSRFHLALDALKHVPRFRLKAASAINFFNQELQCHHDYIREHLEDMPEIRNWQWTKDFSNATTRAPLAKGHPREGHVHRQFKRSLYTGSSSGYSYSVGLCQPPSAAMSASAAFGPQVPRL